MKRGIVAIVLAGALATTLSGCFFLRSFKLSDYETKKGKPVTAKVTENGSDQAKGYEWFMVAYPTGSKLSLGHGEFRYLGKTRSLQRDQSLAAFIQSDGSCDDSPVNIANFPGGADLALLRTKTQIEATSDADKLARVSFDVTPHKRTSYVLLAVTGYWADDGDAVPEGDPDDAIVCVGGASATLFSGGAAPAKPDLLDALP